MRREKQTDIYRFLIPWESMSICEVNANQPKVQSENLFLREFSELLPSLEGMELSENRAEFF